MTSKNNQLAKVSDAEIPVPTSPAEVAKTIEALKTKLKELKGEHADQISLDISYGTTNIKSVQKVQELLEISASINARNKAYQEEIIRYGLTGRNIAEFTVSGKTAAEWVKIIEKAIFELINKVAITNIESAISELSKHLSAEEQLREKLKSITDLANQPIQ